jgi:dTDP-glucose pyrophosphorylase
MHTIFSPYRICPLGAHVDHQGGVVLGRTIQAGTTSSVAVDADWHVKRIIEKPSREEIMSPYAASILFILPPQLWHYLPQIQPSARGEIEMQAAVQMMIEDGLQAFGVLQPAPEEWSLAHHTPPVP